MEQTDAALSELAEQLGISVGELWGWLQGSGVQSYAAARIAQSITTIAMAFVFFIICLYFFRFFYKKHEEWEDTYRTPYDDNPYVLPIILLPILALGCFFVAAITLPDLIGWIASPEGMVIDILTGH